MIFWSFRTTIIIVKSKYENRESRRKIEKNLLKNLVLNEIRRNLFYIEKSLVQKGKDQ